MAAVAVAAPRWQVFGEPRWTAARSIRPTLHSPESWFDPGPPFLYLSGVRCRPRVLNGPRGGVDLRFLSRGNVTPLASRRNRAREAVGEAARSNELEIWPRAPRNNGVNRLINEGQFVRHCCSTSIEFPLSFIEQRGWSERCVWVCGVNVGFPLSCHSKRKWDKWE